MAELFLVNPVRRKKVKNKRKTVRTLRRKKSRRKSRKTKIHTIMKNPKTVTRRKRRSRSRSRTARFGHTRSFIAKPQAEFSRAISHDNLKIAGGALAASFLTTFIFGKFGPQLPLNNYPIIYKIGIPVLGAVLLRSYSSRVADGMVIGATLMGGQEVLKLAMPNQAANSVVLNENPDFAGYGEDAMLDEYAGDDLVGSTLDAIEDSSYEADGDDYSYAADPFADNQSFTGQTW